MYVSCFGFLFVVLTAKVSGPQNAGPLERRVSYIYLHGVIFAVTIVHEEKWQFQ